MIIRSIDNTIKGKFNLLEIDSPEENPVLFNGLKAPITLFNTYNLQITPTTIKILENGIYYDVLHRNSKLNVIVNENNVGQVKEGQPAVVGNNMNKKASPAPFCYVDETGAVNSVVASNSIWNDSVMGYTAQGKPDTYAQGFVPSGSAIHNNLFLRKDGQWGQPSVHTGSVADTFLSLLDTPTAYNGNLDKYLRVSYANGGRVIFDAIDTSKVPESTNLYYTEDRVDSRILLKATDGTLPSLSVVNTVTATEYVCSSDVRLKTEIESLHGSLSLVRQLKPKRYKFKGDAKTRFGLIAQDVGGIKELSHLVRNEAVGGMKAVNYIDIIPLLIDSIQSLSEEVSVLKSKLEKR